VAAALATAAIVLRTVAYGEADLIVTLLGRSTGRVSGLARGARKSPRRFGGGLGLGATGEAALRERAGAELMGLEGFEVQRARIGLGQDLARTAHAAYGVELCDRLCAPRQPEPAVFDWLDELLTRLEEVGASAGRLRVFELGLLERLGLGPAVDRCLVCGHADLDAPGRPVRWHPERGGVVCGACARTGSVLTPPVRQALTRLATMSLAEADAAPLPPEINAGCRLAMGELLQHHIPGPLRSLEFIDKIAAAGRPSR
jgi:DNA repair protein RecO (recombination protein O)